MTKLKYIYCDESKCTGCRACELACSVAHDNVFSPAQARIHVYTRDLDSTAVACRHCPKAPCIDICPVGARTKMGALTVICEEKCIGCDLCTEACPFGASLLHSKKKVAIICDLCDGKEPACIKVCIQNALSLKEVLL